jgi:hypothetical protein
MGILSRQRLIALSATGLAVLAAVTLGSGIAGGAADHRPREILAASHRSRVKTDLGSYCVQRGRTGECADSVFRGVPRPKLPVRAGDRVVLITGDREIGRVHAAGLHIHGFDFAFTGWDRRARRVHGTRSRWCFRLLGDLGNANAIDLEVRYRHHIGDAEYAFGIKPRR